MSEDLLGFLDLQQSGFDRDVCAGVCALLAGPLNPLLPVPAGGHQTGRETSLEQGTNVFGHQTTTDISPGQYVFYLTGGEMVILVPKNNKYLFLFKLNFLKIYTIFS